MKINFLSVAEKEPSIAGKYFSTFKSPKSLCSQRVESLKIMKFNVCERINAHEIKFTSLNKSASKILCL